MNGGKKEKLVTPRREEIVKEATKLYMQRNHDVNCNLPEINELINRSKKSELVKSYIDLEKTKMVLHRIMNNINDSHSILLIKNLLTGLLTSVFLMEIEQS